MSEELLVRHCSPTLAGMKTGNLFSCFFESEEALCTSLCHWNQLFFKKGLRMVSLRFQNNRALIYLYRPSLLSQDLKHATACRLLRKRGYGMESPEHSILHLMKRLDESNEFPHEIGLFLGYPPEDVCGFIENKANGYKYAGYWKVYGNAKAAQKLFAKYKKCTEIYRTQLAKGNSIERLTVVS